MATQALVDVTLDSFVTRRAHAFNMSRAGERARFGMDAVVMTDVCRGQRKANKHKRRPLIRTWGHISSVICASLIRILQKL